MPPIVIEHDGITVVRDDLVEGGTKRPVLAELLPVWTDDEFVFPAASEGYGQIALALAARDAGKRATIFVAERKTPTPETQAALDAGANVVGVPQGRYSVVQCRAREYAAEHGARYLPPGFADPEFLAGVAERARSTRLEPHTVVVTVGSGALCRGLMLGWPDAYFIAVKVGMRPDVGRAEIVVAPEEYSHVADEPPPFPSAPYQDAKAWRFVSHDRGVVFWNIAG